MTSAFPTTTVDHPARRMSRLAVSAAHRALAKVRLRLRQSVRGYATAAELAASPNVSRFANRYAAHRTDDLARLEKALWEDKVHAGTLNDIAGTLHRRWMSIVASGSDATLIAEIDRGEASLERAVRTAIAVPTRASLEAELTTGELNQLLQNVVETRQMLRELPVLASRSSS